MPLWEYCEVAYTPKQVLVHIWSSRDQGMYEGIQKPEEWGMLLAQLGADGWELVGVVPTRPANHSLYYFKRPLDSSAQAEWEERQAQLRESTKKRMEQQSAQQQSASDHPPGAAV